MSFRILYTPGSSGHSASSTSHPHNNTCTIPERLATGALDKAGCPGPSLDDPVG